MGEHRRDQSGGFPLRTPPAPRRVTHAVCSRQESGSATGAEGAASIYSATFHQASAHGADTDFTMEKVTS